jgi:hypothetical protein
MNHLIYIYIDSGSCPSGEVSNIKSLNIWIMFYLIFKKIGFGFQFLVKLVTELTYLLRGLGGKKKHWKKMAHG